MANTKKDSVKSEVNQKPREANAKVRDATGTSSPELQRQMLKDVLLSIRLLEQFPEEERGDQVAAALASLQDIGPSDVLEGMLAAQMIVTHRAAMECLAKSGEQEQRFLWRDMYMKHAAKLLALYIQQMAALDKHRGKGQQKVTVEHVHVAPGGQAFVGTVDGGEKGGGRGSSELRAPAQLEGNLESPFEVEKLKSETRRSK